MAVCSLKNKRWGVEGGGGGLKTLQYMCVYVFTLSLSLCLHLPLLVCLPLCDGGQSYYFSIKIVIRNTRAFLVSVHLTKLMEIDVNIPYDILSFY